MATLSVVIDGTEVTASYSVTTPPSETGDIPMGLMEATPLGVIAAGFQNAGDASPSGGRVAIGADVAGVHLSLDGGKTYRPIRAGAGSSDKSRICGLKWADESTLWAYTTGWNSGLEGGVLVGTVGTGVDKNYLLRMKLQPDGTPTQWETIHQVPGGWASAQNRHQKGDSKASSESGHPRNSKNRCLLIDKARGYAYVTTWDGIVRMNLDGTGSPTKVWGSGNSITSLVMDPNNDAVIYATVDLGPKVGVWRLTGLHTGVVTEVGCTGTKFDYPQSVDAVKVGAKTALVVATGKLLSATDRTNGLVWLPAGASFAAASWRDITGTILEGETDGKARVSGVAVRAVPDGFAITASNSYDTQPGGTTKRIWWNLAWDGVGSPNWQSPNSSNTTYLLGGDPTEEELWFQHKQPTLMGDKPGFDCVSPFFVDDETIIYPGRSGIWRMRARLGARAFHPVDRGLLVTYAWCVASYALDPRKVICGDTDWGDLYLLAPWLQPYMRPSRPRQGSATTLPIRGIAQNGAGAVAIAGTEGADTGVWVSQNPFAAAPVWVDELGTGSNKPTKGTARGVELWGSDSTQVLLVAMQGDGVWRKDGTGATGAWSKVFADITGDGKETRVRFGKSGNTVVVCDQATGIYRSTNRGATGSWAKVKAGASGGWTSGHVTPDPAVAGKFYIVYSGDILVLTSTDTAPTTLKAFGSAQGFAIDPITKTMWVAEGGTARLWKCPTGGDWTDVTTPSWRNTSGIVRDMTITTEGILLVANQAAYCGVLTRAA